jgi:hypothetical protein
MHRYSTFANAVTAARGGLWVYDSYLGEHSSESSAYKLSSNMSQIDTISAYDFASSMMIIEDSFGFMPHALQNIVSRSFGIYRTKVVERRLDAAILKGHIEAKKCYSAFIKANSWKMVVNAMDSCSNEGDRGDVDDMFLIGRMRKETSPPKIELSAEDKQEVELTIDLKMEILLHFENIIQETIKKANETDKIKLASDGVRNKLQSKKMVKAMISIIDAFETANPSRIMKVLGSVVDEAKQLGISYIEEVEEEEEEEEEAEKDIDIQQNNSLR